MPDRDDFEDFVAARYQPLLRTAYLLTGHRADAEDLLQTTLARCVPAWRRISGDPEPYVRKVMVRENVTRWRRRRWREVTTDADDDTFRVAVTDPSVPDRVVLADALGQLPPRQRTAVVLRHVEGQPEREVARVMGCSVGTVKSQTHAGLARLRVLLGEDGEDRPATGSTIPSGSHPARR
ncbi:SigE family RNA polymerase sigma factor [Nocardioides oleivorans]|uniref:SigE family RNA polymerase sigma factor n=1 Tax=Nocardioides oleivorans TaxID=273676 RepID=A0A4Q2RVB4_9ACTN|nr:SigE family RNA polymerase sigma factor [Nocardioides oleivorans]RYB91835.1 SigE family RNA polymerase sigma factor [Nocardioides oleivorans]